MKIFLDSKTILITGGTGSFGNAFVTKILTDYPKIKKIIIYSRDEYKQFMMQQEPLIMANKDKIRFFIGDIRDAERMNMACKGVDIVVHAAAMKQIVAAEYNPFECIKTNVLGAQNIVMAAIQNKVQKVVALSTDKACAPVNLYGATKLCSDRLFLAGSAYVGTGKTTFSVVRYGNVAASRGSVIPFFANLIKNGAKTIPITHPDMTRFWLTLQDSVEMVLDCIEQSIGGELFIKKIPSIKITKLAKLMAPNLEQQIVGIRPGEKIHETLMTFEESRNAIENDKYYIVLPNILDNATYVEHYGNKQAKLFEYNSGDNEIIDDKIISDFILNNI